MRVHARARPAPPRAPPRPAYPPWQGGLGRIRANLASRVKKGRMSEGAAAAAMARVKVGGRVLGLARLLLAQQALGCLLSLADTLPPLHPHPAPPCHRVRSTTLTLALWTW